MKQSQTPSLNSRQLFLEWYHATKMGQLLQTIEASYLQSSLKLTYNQKTLQVGRLGSETRYIPEESISNFALVDDNWGESSHAPYSIVGSIDELPIANGSIDTLILPHLIEFETNRHQILREAERVLKPEGRLVILGFNPWSLHGIRQSIPLGATVFRSDPVGSDRLMEWLSLLRFEAELNAAFSARADGEIVSPDTLISKYRARISLAYCIKAIKRRYTMIPADSVWLATSPGLVAGHMFKTHV